MNAPMNAPDPLRGPRAVCAAVALLGIAACAGPGAATRRDASPGLAADGPATFRRLVADIERIPPRSGGARPIASALRHLAATLLEVDESHSTVSRSVRLLRASDLLASGEAGSTSDAPGTGVLDLAARSLDGLLASRSNAATERERAQAVAAAAVLDPKRPLAAQGGVARSVLMHVATGVYAWAHPEAGARRALAPENARAAGPCQDLLLAAVTRASSAVRGLANPEPRQLAQIASSLEALAQAIRGAAGRDPVVAAALSRMSGDIAVLQRADDVDFDAPAATQDGLLAAVDGIRRIAGALEADDVEPWMRDAEVAARAIDTRMGLAFQRADIQEAFRSATDGLLALAHATSRCASDPPSMTLREAAPMDLRSPATTRPGMRPGSGRA